MSGLKRCIIRAVLSFVVFIILFKTMLCLAKLVNEYVNGSGIEFSVCHNERAHGTPLANLEIEGVSTSCYKIYI